MRIVQTTTKRVPATRHEAGAARERLETVAEETPVALVYNGRAHAVMMATPADLDDFAVGFSLSEGIVDNVSQVRVVDRLQTVAGISMQMLIPQHRFDALDARERNLTGRTGCGLCGTASLEAAIRPVRRVTTTALASTGEVLTALRVLAEEQSLNHATGAVHAAAVLTDEGRLIAREDVGRHNAVDKAFGAAVRAGHVPRALVVTSRASYEIVHKAAQLDCALVAAVSAPTALAIRIAQDAGVTLVGFAREGRLTVYAGALARDSVEQRREAVLQGA